MCSRSPVNFIDTSCLISSLVSRINTYYQKLHFYNYWHGSCILKQNLQYATFRKVKQNFFVVVRFKLRQLLTAIIVFISDGDGHQGVFGGSFISAGSQGKTGSYAAEGGGHGGGLGEHYSDVLRASSDGGHGWSGAEAGGGEEISLGQFGEGGYKDWN